MLIEENGRDSSSNGGRSTSKSLSYSVEPVSGKQEINYSANNGVAVAVAAAVAAAVAGTTTGEQLAANWFLHKLPLDR